MFKLFFSLLFSSLLVFAESIDDAFDGFDDEVVEIKKKEVPKKEKSFLDDFTGRLTEQLAYSYNGDSPHDNISSLKSSLFLDYEHKFANDFKIKTNAKAYYDAIYKIRGVEKYSQDERDELESEVELFDAYLEGSLLQNLDIKVGRQVVVWGRSDTIRITDILNPLDNRRPALVDIEDLRLPVSMLKMDYFFGKWRITPLVIFEQRFSKNPPAGSAFNPQALSLDDEKYSDLSPAISIGGEFEGWDVNFYAARVHNDTGYVKAGKIHHDKVNMLGFAVNVLYDTWLFKSELAHFDGLKYTATHDKEFQRTDGLVGFEYNGIVDTILSYDVSLRKIDNYETTLLNNTLAVKENTYQHAFRVSSDFINGQLKANYLVTLYGADISEGGFQRAWIKYDIQDGVYANVGVVDYIKGSKFFDTISNNDMLFIDVTYSF